MNQSKWKYRKTHLASFIILWICLLGWWIRSMTIGDGVIFRSFGADWHIASKDSAFFVERISEAPRAPAKTTTYVVYPAAEKPPGRFRWNTLGFDCKSIEEPHSHLSGMRMRKRIRITIPYWLPALVVLAGALTPARIHGKFLA